MEFVRLLLVGGLLLVSCVSKPDGKQSAREAAVEAGRKASLQRVEAPSYQIGPGDSLRIEHRFNEELNRVVTVRPDGCVTLPLVNDVRLAGRTTRDAGLALDEVYSGTVRNPGVRVSVENATNGKICVAGEVITPGLFPMSEGLTVLRALTLAGGPRPTARLTSVIILRDDGQPQPQYLIANLKRSTTRLDGRGEIRLQPKDVVFVPRTTIASMDAFVDQYFNQLIPFQKSLGVTYLIGGGAIY